MDSLDLAHIDDEPLKATVEKVFRRLPESVQQNLISIIREIVANSGRDKELEMWGRGGATSCEDEGCPGFFRYRIYLSRKMQSEAARTLIAAHEFAHVYLRHPTYIFWISHNAATPEMREQMVLAVEDQANLQVCLWGFKDELLTFHQEFPHIKKPTFLELL